LGAPPDYAATLGPLPPNVKPGKDLRGEKDFVHFFSQSRHELEQRFPALKSGLATNGMLWIAWPKRSSGIATDLDESVVRKIGLAHGLVDMKVCAVDDTWSGLKFVYRLKDRK
jgi:hypothetical protein